MPVFLTIACLLLLVAAGSLAYIFLSRGTQSISATPALTANPRQLRINDTFTLSGNGFGVNGNVSFTRDVNITIADGSGRPLHARTDAAGAFSVQITISPSWQPGQHRIYAVDETQLLSVSTTVTIQKASLASPHLKLSDAQINLGSDVPGATSSESITLINGGGGQLTWQASSDQPWLTVAPNGGIFSGSASVALTANRGTLTPQTYSGNVTFTQQGSNDAPLMLKVTMTVKPAPVSLSVLPAALAYSGSAGRNPPDQAIVIQNNGGQGLEWNSSVATGDGAAWLSINPSSGYLDPGASATIMVSVRAQNLAIGMYKGTISFRGGTNSQVTVTLGIVAPGNLVASPPSLNFTATTGKNPAGQSLTLQNSGGQPLDWTLTTGTASSGQWLSVRPASGHLEPDAKAAIIVNVNTNSLKAGSYQGVLTFRYGASTKQVAVSLTVSPPPAAVIGLDPPTLTFAASHGTNPAPQTFTIINTGNATLNWHISEDQSGTTYVSVIPTGGSLAPGKQVQVTVSPAVAQVNAGQTIIATITVADSDPGSIVQGQDLTATITITG